MMPMTHEPQFNLLPERADSLDDEVASQVWELLSTLYPRHDLGERRRENRFPFPYLIHLTPVDQDGITPDGETIVVVGKHLSERGLGFYHPKPLAHRRMIASLEMADSQRLAFVVDLSWCRFTKQGWYESGGRFIEPATLPGDAA